MSKQYYHDMGWSKHPNLRHVHYWQANLKNQKIQTLCKFAVALYRTCRDAEPADERCPDCVKALEAAP